ncbi:phosphotransferase [Flavilitoribacter nigricans]|uniref:Uncharacterized protein n=1 Tax=Flavilitoribacter nigricans (strain ATCC 23147 / DSM 23189 / NBRC 102662 / NCIMB 1420 / SS-2) TaxID=1122177 RepID=A0A2D0MZH7_FLAN2|nr:phosphotransferase [Flavilitoribacter nigricans]PHN01702.1 hypothetical protein CRP01_35740 [Flavilitoribacter nigricans DSM 23189 = NBRC 102662]
MKHADVQALIQGNPRLLPEAQLVETHISWVLLTDKNVYKIKKPVDYTFLNFSTLEKRKFYCDRELFLNRRLTDGVYLDVVPILREDYTGVLSLGGEEGTVIDYAVKMKRLDSDRQMDLMLENDLVTMAHMEQLAEQLTDFHMSTEVVTAHPNIHSMHQDFADFLRVAPFIEKHWGADAALLLHKGEEHSKQVLKSLQDRIYERHLEGFTVDGHGDLHAKNIFLLEKPVIFDCIEFNDHLRKLDVLNELAFLCMDLDAKGQTDLSDGLLEAYNQRYICVNNGPDEKLFEYYKLYRANVRLKINVFKAMQLSEGPELDRQLVMVRTFLDLFGSYLNE